MKKIIASTIILASIFASLSTMAGGDKDKEKKSCSSDKKACCAKSKSNDKNSNSPELKKTDEKPQ